MFNICVETEDGKRLWYDLTDYAYLDMPQDFIDCDQLKMQTNNHKMNWQVVEVQCDVPCMNLDMVGHRPSEDDLSEAVLFACEYENLNEDEQIILAAYAEDNFSSGVDDMQNIIDDIHRHCFEIYHDTTLAEICQERFLDGEYFSEDELSCRIREHLQTYIDFEYMANDYELSYTNWLTQDNNNTCDCFNVCIEEV